ncbi:hypothetical protein DLM75_11035 [Leptospira stimsonii]|uniref:Uncharacterized protein n=1 Tax=Leptospira stimsonii TaxID=2202203 RepID=A0A396Z5W9_9LEPT|nr:hypothetical protein DLM75_11035 [Leptospira stimsonii]
MTIGNPLLRKEILSNRIFTEPSFQYFFFRSVLSIKNSQFRFRKGIEKIQFSLCTLKTSGNQKRIHTDFLEKKTPSPGCKRVLDFR